MTTTPKRSCFIFSALLTTLFASSAYSQGDGPPEGMVLVTSIPSTGLFWSMAQDTPPYPWDPLPSLNLYTADGTNYYFDDRNYDYSAGADNETLGVIVRGETFQPDDSGPPGTGSGGTGSGGGATVTYSPINFDDFSCPDNCGVVISNVYGAGEVVVGITNGVPGVVYNVLTNAVLGSTTGWSVQQSITATATVTWGTPISTSVSSNLFFIAKFAWPAILWVTNLPCMGDQMGPGMDSSPALSWDANEVYVTSTGNFLFALNAETGAIEFSNGLTTANGEITPSPSLATNGNIIVGSTDGFLFSFTNDLAVNWSNNLSDLSPASGVYATPAVTAGNTIYIGLDEAGQLDIEDTGFFSFNTRSSENWNLLPNTNTASGADIDSSAAVATDGTVYFLGEDNRLYALRPDSSVKWFLPVPADSDPSSTPSIGADGTIYVGSDSPYLYAVSPDGSLKWTFHVPNTNDAVEAIYSSPVIDSDGTIYFGEGVSIVSEGALNDQYANIMNTEGGIFAVNDGKQIWAYTNVSGSVIGSAALAADGTVYIGAVSSNHTFGTFYAITNGALRWSLQTSNDIFSSPVICGDGSIVITCEDSNVYEFAGCSPLANAPWPMFQHDPQHTGSLSGTNSPASGCEPAFVYGGFFHDGAQANFGFTNSASPGSTWAAFGSTNLSNWTNTTIIVTNDTNTGIGIFENLSQPFSVSNVFYYLSNDCCSRVIGFVHFALGPGSNFIADPFYQIDEFIFTQSTQAAPPPMNTVAALFSGENQDFGEFPGFNPGTNIIGWNGQGYVTNIASSTLGAWTPNGDLPLLPGRGAIVDIGTHDSQTIWFVGLVPEAITNQILPGKNFLGSALPIAGGISTVLSYTNASAGDWVQKWNPTNQIFVNYTNNGGASWSPREPYIGLCEGFILNSATNHVWIQKFSPCGGD